MDRYKWSFFVPAAVLVGALALRLADPPPTQALRNFTFDTFERLAPRPYVDAGVRVVDLDDQSLARLGQWPWPRTEVARLVDRLAKAGAAAIVFDIVFAEPDRTSPRNVLPIWRDIDGANVPDALLAGLPDHDAVLARTVAGTPTVLGIVLADQAQARPAPHWGVALAGKDVRPFLFTFGGAITNLPMLDAAAAGLGALNSAPDRDGVVRHVPLFFAMKGAASAAEGLYPALSAEALRVAQHGATYIVKGSGASGITAFGEDVGASSVVIGDFTVPTDDRARVTLYDTGSVAQRTIPAWQVLEPDFASARVAGTIVFIGTSAAGLADLRATPLRPIAPGVEIHAEIAEQIVSGAFLTRPNWMTGAELLWMLVLSGALLLALSRVGPFWSAILATAGIAAAFAVSWLAFRHLGLLADPVYPALTALALYLSQSLLHYLRSEHDRRYLRGAFGRYISPALLQQLVDDSSRLRLGGEMRDMSVLFCDIRGFTTLAETMDAGTLTRFVNSFLTPMTELVMKRSGTIDKYIGDCIMAFWNAPLPDAAHAENAVRTALDMLRALEGLNPTWRAEALAEGRRPGDIAIGIGIATGACCVGNLGSEQRFDYSVLGDDVNLASRLEGQTKVFGLPIIISERTLKRLPGFATLELDLLRVKGKIEPRRIFAVLGDETVAAQPWFVQLAAEHQAMLTAFRARRWAEAAELAQRLGSSAVDATRALYTLYAERIERLCRADLPDDWDGVLVAESK